MSPSEYKGAWEDSITAGIAFAAQKVLTGTDGMKLDISRYFTTTPITITINKPKGDPVITSIRPSRCEEAECWALLEAALGLTHHSLYDADGHTHPEALTSTWQKTVVLCLQQQLLFSVQPWAFRLLKGDEFSATLKINHVHIIVNTKTGLVNVDVAQRISLFTKADFDRDRTNLHGKEIAIFPIAANFDILTQKATAASLGELVQIKSKTVSTFEEPTAAIPPNVDKGTKRSLQVHFKTPNVKALFKWYTTPQPRFKFE